MTVREILTEYLRQHGYDGLYSPGECGCSLDELAPCGGLSLDCEAGVKVPCDCGGNCDWHIGPRSHTAAGATEAAPGKCLPTTTEMYGSDPDFTGGMTTDEYIRSMRGMTEAEAEVIAATAEADAAQCTKEGSHGG